MFRHYLVMAIAGLPPVHMGIVSMLLAGSRNGCCTKTRDERMSRGWRVMLTDCY